MSERLTIFSTIEDLRGCSDTALVADIDAVDREVILKYILELREAARIAELGPPIVCPGPPELPVLYLNSEDEEGEQQVCRAKSSRAQIKFTARFKNETAGNIDLIWKDYEGKEVVVRQDIKPGDPHGECTYLTHPFIARDSATGKLRFFNYKSTTSVVFEGLNFGVPHEADVNVTICEEISM